MSLLHKIALPMHFRPPHALLQRNFGKQASSITAGLNQLDF